MRHILTVLALAAALALVIPVAFGDGGNHQGLPGVAPLKPVPVVPQEPVPQESAVTPNLGNYKQTAPRAEVDTSLAYLANAPVL